MVVPADAAAAAAAAERRVTRGVEMGLEGVLEKCLTWRGGRGGGRGLLGGHFWGIGGGLSCEGCGRVERGRVGFGFVGFRRTHAI